MRTVHTTVSVKHKEVWKIFIQCFISLSFKSDDVWDIRYAAYPLSNWLWIVVKQLTPVQLFTKCVFSLKFELLRVGAVTVGLKRTL